MLIGIDYASVDGNLVPRPALLAAACKTADSTLSFAVIRGAYGTTPDDTVARDWRTLTNAGLTVGAYLFLRMPRGGYNASPEDQVHVFADTVGTLSARNFPPALDIEDTGLKGQAELAWVHRAWLEMSRTYGVPPIVYTSQRVWIEDLQNVPAGDMVDSPLWLAKPWPWPVRDPPRLSATFGLKLESGIYDPKVPAPWGIGNWWIHQYQGDARPVPGFTSTVDLSRFHVMREGETGPRVTWVQRRLGMVATGTFDVAMAGRLRTFQALHGLDVDAVIGPKTFAAIAWSAGVEMPPPRAA